MKIELVSYRYNIKSGMKRDLTLKIINNSSSNLILFSGHTITNGKDIKYVGDRIENTKSSIFLELEDIGARDINNWSFKIEKGKLVNCSTHQLFSTSNEINKNQYCAENLYNEIRLKRIHKIGRKKICLLVCGELNILTNLQAQGNAVKIRVDADEIKVKFKELFDSVDIFLNPIHSPMGNQGKMHKRREYFSDNGRAYFSTSNLQYYAIEANYHFPKTKALQYAYYDGSPISAIKEYYDKNHLKRIFEI
ncbi:hypothetical protein ES705_07958 [subsurface metagenome]